MRCCEACGAVFTTGINSVDYSTNTRLAHRADSLGALFRVDLEDCQYLEYGSHQVRFDLVNETALLFAVIP